MKLLRQFLIPAASFAAAWLIATMVSGRLQTPPPEEPPANFSPRERSSPRPDISSRQRIKQLTRDFRAQPMSEWNRLWDSFARGTDLATLKKLAGFPPTGRDACIVAERNLLQVLSREELAMRTGRVVVPAPEAFSALAEIDPAAAWRDLERHYREDHAMAALRSFTLHDPASTLRRFLTLPPAPGFVSEYSDDRDGANRSGIIHSPLGAIFGSWARSDPRAAAEAAMKLPMRHRREAVGKLALAWAYHDGPAAIDFLLKSGALNRGVNDDQIRLDVILRASFRTHPAATARLVAQHIILREVAADHRVVKPWYRADPDGVIAWILEGEIMTESQGSTHDNQHSQDRAAGLFRKLEPEDAADFFRKLSAAGSISPITAMDPASLLKPRADVDPPAVACDRWLAALRTEGDPERALAAAGMTKSEALALAVSAARASPDRAAQLVKLIPVEWFGFPRFHDRKHLARFWPELANHSSTAPPGEPEFPTGRFILDPASAITEFQGIDPSPADVGRVVKLSAPYVPQVAAEWVAGLPAGPTRQHAEWLLAVNQVGMNPELPLRFIIENPGFQPLKTGASGEVGLAGFDDGSDRSVIRICQTSLRQIRANGGDWRAWLDRLPEAIRNAEIDFPRGSVAKDLAAEAAFLDKLSRHAPR